MRNRKELFSALRRSRFRSRFKLGKRERDYFVKHGAEAIRHHARDFLRERIAPAEPKNDGRQTPMRGHPVFIAQHATGICCRSCLAKWHGIPKKRLLSGEEIEALVNVLMEWIAGQIGSQCPQPGDKNSQNSRCEGNLFS